MPEGEKCTLCNRTMRQHEVAEQEGLVHHKFSSHEGQMEPLTGDLKPKDKLPAPQIMMGPPGDPVLRTILIEAGLITLEDIEKAERTLRATGVIRTHGNPA